MTTKEQENNSQELMSKKDVLETFGISYGQFYRWKRKGLIPESWFIRKSTFTGQETFLPKSKIQERIETILRLKETYSLEEIAEYIAPEMTEAHFELGDLLGNVISKKTMKNYLDFTGLSGPFPFWDVVQIALFEELSKHSLEKDEVKLALSTLNSETITNDDEEVEWTLWVVRKSKDMSLSCIAPRAQVRFDSETEVVAQIDLISLMEETKMSLRRV
jgi:DNA-binding transcriptional MerR regulator